MKKRKILVQKTAKTIETKKCVTVKKGTHLGTIVPVVSNVDELLGMFAHDAEVVGKEIEQIIGCFNLRMMYDREVLLLMMANITAATISSLEDFDPEYEERMRHLIDFHLGEYRKIKEESNN